MHVETADTQGNANIGLYAFATNTYCILGPEAENLKELIEEVLQVPVFVTTIAGTSLAGVFCAGNDEKLLVPNITFDHELDKLSDLPCDVQVIETNNTALGNLVVANAHGCLVARVFSEAERKRIEKAMGIATHQLSVADVDVVGSSIAVNSTGGVVHPNASSIEQEMIIDTLKLERLLPGTINFGVPYVRSGLIANDAGFLIGKTSGGPEITNADEGFGFIEG